MLHEIVMVCLGIDTPAYVTPHSVSTNCFGNLYPAYLFCDTETGGTNPRTDAVCSVSAVLTNKDFEPLALFDTYVRYDPAKNYSREAENIHGITKEELNDADLPTLADVAQELYDMAQMLSFGGETFQLIFGGHNAQFDWNFLTPESNALSRVVHPYRKLDTAAIALVNNHYASLNGLYQFTFNGKGPKLPFWVTPIYGSPDNPSRDIHSSLLDTLVCVQGCWKAARLLRQN